MHKTCSGLSDEGFKYVQDQLQTTGLAYWACRACTSYAMGMNHRLKMIEENVEKVSKAVKDNSEAIKEMDKKVDAISEGLKKKDDRVEGKIQDQQREMYEELRERDIRKKNVIFHGIQELQKENATYKERVEWDRASISNILRELKLNMKEDAVKFSKRIGEAGGSAARPILAGFHMEMDKLNLLRVARNLENSRYSDVNVVPDLTKRQRDEEAELKREAERRNKSLTETDVSKNLHWVVVGARGERRLTKEKVDSERSYQRGGPARGGARGGRGVAPSRGRILTGANRSSMGPTRSTRSLKTTDKARRTETAEEIVESEEMETEGVTESESETETEQVAAVKQGKRKNRSREGLGDEPPVKK
jgi:hypothetical protein